MQAGRPLINYSDFEPHYNEVSEKLVHEPEQNRRCTDPFCVFILLAVAVGYFIIGVMGITDYNSTFSSVNLQEQTNKIAFAQHFPVILLGIVIGIVTAYIYVVLLKQFPKAMVYFMIIFTLSVIAGIGLWGLFMGNLGLSISMGVTLLIYLILLLCLRKQIKTGIALITVAAKFMSERLIVFFTPIIKIILTFVVVGFGSWSINCLAATAQYKDQHSIDSSQQKGFISLLSLFLIAFTFIFYYMMTYTISVVCSYWYYGIQGGKGSLLNAYVLMFKQIGSLAFAAFLIAVVTFARMMVQNKRRQTKNIAAAICLCLVQCCLKAIQNLLKVLNHYSIILMAVTGQDYVSTAKSTMGLLWRQLPLLSVTNLITNFLVFWGIIITVSIPCIISALIMKSQSSSDLGAVVAAVGICSFLVSLMVFEILVQGVSCIFIYFAMDKSFLSRGLITNARIQTENYDRINVYSANPYLREDGDGGSYGKI